jgi:DNA-binding response OmpR family regulator
MNSILIINDSRILTPLFVDLFNRQGWSVHDCSTRECALNQLSGDRHYDAILSGHIIGTDEVQLVGLIRAFEHRKTAVVVSMVPQAEMIAKAEAAGADVVMVKPVNPNSLVATVAKQLS